MAPRANHELITGPFQPALEDALAGRIRSAQAAERGEPVMVLVGSNLLAVYLRRRLAETLPLWNVRFFTFAELARKLGSGLLSERGRKPLPELAQQMIVRSVVREQAAGYFTPVADLPGFVRTTAASINDLKEAGLGPADLAKLPGPKLAAFRRICLGYQDVLESQGLYDSADLLDAAAEAAAGSDLVASADFIAYGFYDLTGLQRRLLLALAGRARSATVMVPAVGAPAHEYARPLVEWLRQNGFRSRTTAAAADPLTARLFASPAGTPLEAGEFRILSVPGEPREAREIVRQVLDYARRGIPFHEIAVLLRNPEAYSRLLRDAFGLRGIPYFIAGGVPLAETKEARSLEMLAALLAGDLRRADVMQFVHFAPIAFERLLGRVANTADWDLLSIQAGVVSGEEQWTRRLATLGARPRDDGEGDAGPALGELPHLRDFIGRLIAAKRAVPNSGSWSEMTTALVHAYRGMTEPTEAREGVCLAVEGLGQFDAFGAADSFDEVRSAITELLARRRTPAKGFQRGCVYVGGLFESRGLHFRAVILPGLVEKSFPAPGRQDPILLDSERAALAKTAGRGAYLPLKSARTAEEQMLFALALSSSAGKTALTFSRLEVAAARERIPSHFLTRLAEALTGKRCDYSLLERAPGFVRVAMFPARSGDVPDLDENDYDLRTLADLADAGRPEAALYLANVAEPFRRGVEAETARWQQKRFTRFDGVVASALPSPLGQAVSPTRLEHYAGCPFAYFLKYVLGLEKLEEPEQAERITPLERGALVHDVLFAAYARCYSAQHNVSEDELAAALREAAEAEFRRRGPVGPALTWALDRAGIMADLRRLAAVDAADCQAAHARPAFFETRFGMATRGPGEGSASTETPLELAFGGHTCRFKGKIDRIDLIGPVEARVIDYKTGAKTGKPDSFNGGCALQLPIYILAAEMLLRTRRVGGARYWFATARGNFASVEFTRTALEARMDDLEQIVTTILDGIRRGLFIARPVKERCRTCGLKDACGANADILFERKKSDPAIAGLLKMTEIE